MLTFKPPFALFIGVLLVLLSGLFGGNVVKGQYSKIYSTYIGPPPANTGITIGPGGSAGTLGSVGAAGSASIANTGNINDADLTNSVTLSAQSGASGSGLLGGDGGASSAYINLNFAGATTPINGTPIIIKLTASILSSVTVQAYNSGVAVGTSQAFSALSVSSINEYVFVAPGNCNSIRITSATGAGTALGGVSINNTNLFYAYIFDPTCNPPNYTATSKTQILDLGSGFVNPTNAIDGDITTFSKFSVGLGVGTTLYQDVYFSKLSNTGDAATITLAIPPAALSAGVLGYLNLNIYNGNTLISNNSFGGLLLGTDLLTLLNAGSPVTVSIIPTAQFNRIQVSMSSLVGLATSLNLYEVQVTPPEPTFTPPVTLPGGLALSICTGNSTTITANSPGVGNELRWYDAPTGGNLKFTGNPYVTGVLTANLKLYVATAKTGCTAESERIPVVVTVNPLPTVNPITGSSTVCAGSTTPLANTTAGGIWSSSNTAVATVNSSGVVTGVSAGTANIIYTVTDGVTGCTNSSTLPVTVFAPPTASNAGTNQNLCNSTIATLSGNNPTTGSGLWTMDSGPNTPTITAPSLYNSGVTGLIAGTYVFRWTITNGPCTSSSSTVTITIAALPTTANAGADQNLCSVTTTTLTGNVPVVGTGIWNFTSGPNTPSITSPSSNSTQVTGLTTGTYIFKWIIMSGVCTMSTSDVTVIVNPLPTITLGANPTYCQGSTNSSIPYSAVSSAPTTYSIIWNSAALTAGFINVTNISLPATPINITVPPLAAATTYSGSITVKNANGCVSTPINFNIVVHPKPPTPHITAQ